MIVTEQDEQVADYTGFDFRRMWERRDKVTEVERAIVRATLADGDPRRILEVGTGFGRLLGTVTSLGREVVATDFDVGSLERVQVPAVESGVRVIRVAANLYHLPFVDDSLTGATMVRVYHHLMAPRVALGELSRVLRPGSTLLVSYQPRPSAGTLIGDVQRALRAAENGRPDSATFSRGTVIFPAAPFPIRCGNRQEFQRTELHTGFDCVREVGAGFEEYSILRRLPARLFVHGGTALGRAPAFPTRFAVLRKAGESSGPLPTLSGSLACPRCGQSQPDWLDSSDVLCRNCGFVGGRRGPVLDLRWVPPGIPRRKVGA